MTATKHPTSRQLCTLPLKSAAGPVYLCGRVARYEVGRFYTCGTHVHRAVRHSFNNNATICHDDRDAVAVMEL